MQTITIRVGKDGSCNFDMKGIKGKGCADIAGKLATALGVAEKMEKTSEFYEAEQNVNTNSATR